MKNNRLQSAGIFRDDQGVALTEFCIAMPVVLFMFLAILQYYEIVRASQMVNYASYVAARSFAVLHLQDKAKDSAIMALAPISNNLGSGGGSLGSGLSGITSTLGTLASAIPGGTSAARYASGLASASMSLSLGNFTVTTNAISGSSLYQVSVSINYPQFINIPGFKIFWEMFSGHDNFFASQNAILADAAYLNQNYTWSKGLGSGALAAGMLWAQGCVDVPSKCATGYEAWGNPADYNAALNTAQTQNEGHKGWWGSSTQYQPRNRRNLNNYNGSD